MSIMHLPLFRMGLFGAAHRLGGCKNPLLIKTCHKYPAMMKRRTVIPYIKTKSKK